MVVSVPRELSSDHSAVLLLAESSGRITEAEISERLQWEGSRPRRVLDELMQVCSGDFLHFLQSATRYDVSLMVERILVFRRLSPFRRSAVTYSRPSQYTHVSPRL